MGTRPTGLNFDSWRTGNGDHCRSWPRRRRQPQITPSRHEQAPTAIGQWIRDCPDTGGVGQLRRSQRSVCNQHHLLNFWTLASRLDGERSGLAVEVLIAALVENLNDDDTKRALLVAGEMRH
jgi:hypothetical protein